MNGKKAYNTFNGLMLGFLVLVGLGLIIIIFLSNTSFFSKVDEHGCNNNAGYTYSFAKEKCVKVYEEAVQLMKTGSNNPNDLKAFIVFSDDNKSADMFLPGRIYAFLTSSDNFTSWQDNSSKYTLYNSSEKLILKENNQEIFFINK